ncbi:MAG: sugar ABC transporter permease [Anaerolineae bacterium]|nr:sugar ABC transporter permease [Anaerolineae bacterium]
MRSKVKPLLFISPALLYLSVWIYYPILNNLYLSFFDAPTPRSRDYFFVGLQNYIRLFQDELFLKSLWHNILWVLLSIAIPVVMGLVLAVLLAGRRRTRLFYAGVYFIPQTIAAVIAAIVWRWIYDPNIGLLNQALESVGLSGLTQQWLANESLVLVSVNMIGSWTYVGFCVLIFMAGLQNINPTLYDAAMIDGANSLQRFFYITLPLLRSTILFVIVFTIIGSMKFFDLIFVATRGGPNNASYVVGLYIYNLFLHQGRVNYAATTSTVLTAIILLFSVILIRNIISTNNQEA